MSIELIIFLVVWLISTEVAFFGFMRDEFCHFLGEKFISILLGALATVVLFLFPLAISYSFGTVNNLDLIGFVWYYGITLSIAAFFGINYAIHKWLEGKGK